MTAIATTELATGTWAIDPVHSSIIFSVRHMMISKVRGRFEKFRGAIVIGENGEPSVRAEIAIDSISTGNDQRDGHIKSPDFFDAERHPLATFTSTAVLANAKEAQDYVLDGELTLKGVTKPISIGLQFNGVNPGMGNGEVAGFEASAVLNRKDFGIDFDMPLETGGALVGDKVSISLLIEAVKQS